MSVAGVVLDLVPLRVGSAGIRRLPGRWWALGIACRLGGSRQLGLACSPACLALLRLWVEGSCRRRIRRVKSQPSLEPWVGGLRDPCVGLPPFRKSSTVKSGSLVLLVPLIWPGMSGAP